ncbi:MAG: polysaccharide deacetylase family protein [Candidatus Spechtbacteria bacterium]|nr:polysaccharide deacetylase family protein [Candidatus Spechtbacteria bacterium]
MSKEGRVCFVSVDVEHDVGTGANKEFHGVTEMDKILRIFKKFEIPLTLFVTGDVLQKYSDEGKKWAEEYEIASHSYSHRFLNELSDSERREDTRQFLELYQRIFHLRPSGFRAPSHIIDTEALKVLEEYGFIYDSSVVPHYPPFKKYRGYKERAPREPYRTGNIIEIPVSGQIFGLPLAGAWIAGLPSLLYEILFTLYAPDFLTLSVHSWDVLRDEAFYSKLEKVLLMLKQKRYIFKKGIEIANEFLSKN